MRSTRQWLARSNCSRLVCSAVNWSRSEDGLVEVVTGSLEVGGHCVDVIGGLVVLVAAAAGQAAQAGGGGLLVLPVAQALLPVGQVTLAGPDGGVGLRDAVADVGGTAVQVGSMVVLFGAQVGPDAVGVVHRREGFGLGSGQGGGDLFGRGALRFGDQASAVVAVVEGLAGGVPGVGGSDGAGLAHIAPVAVQGRGGQQVDLVPGAALDPVDGASPAVRHQRAAVVGAAGHEPGLDMGDLAGAVNHGQPGRGDLPDGDHAAIGQPPAMIEIDMGVQQDAIPGLIGRGVRTSPAPPGPPRRSPLGPRARPGCGRPGLRSRRG